MDADTEAFEAAAPDDALGGSEGINCAFGDSGHGGSRLLLSDFSLKRANQGACGCTEAREERAYATVLHYYIVYECHRIQGKLIT